MENQTYQPVSVGSWMLTYLLMCIPLVNLIMLFVWAFSGSTPVSKANWAKASLIWMVIVIVLWFIFGAAMFATLAAATSAQ
ncbi:MAG: hypothetical protein KBA51_08575 [Kiritimatiellae bacterium]|nr:hypothetical protein [Kiritimatiellia bacterium]